jgi:hypothetical protein
MRSAVARRTQIWELEYNLPAVPALERSRGLGSHGRDAGRVYGDSGHYRIDSTTVRAHVSAAGGKGGLIDALLAARGAGSPVSFIAWLMPLVDQSPST